MKYYWYFAKKTKQNYLLLFFNKIQQDICYILLIFSIVFKWIFRKLKKKIYITYNIVAQIVNIFNKTKDGKY